MTSKEPLAVTLTRPGCYGCPFLSVASAESAYCGAMTVKTYGGTHPVPNDWRTVTPAWCPLPAEVSRDVVAKISHEIQQIATPVKAPDPDWWGKCCCYRPGWLGGRHDDPDCEFREK